MSELTYIMKARAEAWGSSVGAAPPEEATAIAREATRSRRRHTVLVGAAGFAVVAALGGAGWLALGGAQDPTPPATTSPSPSASPSSAPSATPSATPAVAPAIIEGFAPVPQLPASEIPWDAVGPGWFVVDHSSGGETPNLDDTETKPYGQAKGGVSLLAPDGTWYAAVANESLGAGQVGGWDGESLWMFREAGTNGEAVYNTVELVGVSSGDTKALNGEAAGTIVPFVPGKALTYAYGGDGLYNSVSAVDKTDQMGGCSDVDSGFWGWEAQDMSFLYSPADGGGVICFGPGETEGSTDVTYVATTSLEGSMGFNTFSHPPQEYSFVGWINDNEFFFARKGGGAVPKMFRYDLHADAITEVNIPIYADVDGWNVTGYFDRVSQRHVIATLDAGGWSVSLFTADGGEVATVEGACESYVDAYSRVDARTSGSRLVVSCPTSGRVAMFNLEDGSRIGAWDLGTERKTSIFDAPDA